MLNKSVMFFYENIRKSNPFCGYNIVTEGVCCNPTV